MTGLKGQRKPAQGKLAPASAALGCPRHHVARPEGARVSGRCAPVSCRPFRADFLVADRTQGGARVRSLALGYFPLPRWGNATARARHDRLAGLVDKMRALVPKLRAGPGGRPPTNAERATHPNAVAASETLRSATVDALVYDLYGLTADEIKLVEGTA